MPRVDSLQCSCLHLIGEKIDVRRQALIQSSTDKPDEYGAQKVDVYAMAIWLWLVLSVYISSFFYRSRGKFVQQQ